MVGRRRADADAVLDAARDCVLAVGVRRTTLTDVARRAGVSRMTIYRRWPDADTLVGDLMTREWQAAVAHTADQLAHSRGPLRPRGVALIVEAAAAVRRHPLLRKIVDVDPEVLVPYLLFRRGASQDSMLDFAVGVIRSGQADGSVRTGDPQVLACAMLLTVQSFVLSAATMADDVTAADLDAEMGVILDRYLTP